MKDNDRIPDLGRRLTALGALEASAEESSVQRAKIQELDRRLTALETRISYYSNSLGLARAPQEATAVQEQARQALLELANSAVPPEDLRPWVQTRQASQAQGFQKLQDSLSEPSAVPPRDYAPSGPRIGAMDVLRDLWARITGRADQ